MGDSCPVGPSGQHHDVYEQELDWEVFCCRDSRVSVLLRRRSGFLPRTLSTGLRGAGGAEGAPAPSAQRAATDCEGRVPLTEGRPSAAACEVTP